MKLWPFKKKGPIDPNQLKQDLIMALKENNSRQFADLCNQNKKMIFANYGEWQKAPQGLQDNAEQFRDYGNFLVGVAQYFAQQGDGVLMQKLIGHADDKNPFDQIKNQLKKAEHLVVENHHKQAIKLLSEAKNGLKSFTGPLKDDMMTKADGLIGVANFHLGKLKEAIACTRQALESCQKSGDIEGIMAYSGNLVQMYRQNNQPDEAEKFNQLLEKTRFEQNMAASPRIDETKLIYRDAEGRELRGKDLQGYNGKVDWEISTCDVIPQEARRWHEEGRQLGAQQKFDEAKEAFLKAAQLAPAWPYPYYDLAFTYVLQKDVEMALAYFEKVDEMAPRGFFNSKVALHSLQREQKGQLPPETYLTFISLEWLQDNKKLKDYVFAIRNRCPNFAPIWPKVATYIDDAEQRLEVFDKGLACDPDPDTRGLLLINKAAALNHLGYQEEAVKILSQLALDPETTLQNEHLSKFMLGQILGEAEKDESIM